MRAIEGQAKAQRAKGKGQPREEGGRRTYLAGEATHYQGPGRECSITETVRRWLVRSPDRRNPKMLKLLGVDASWGASIKPEAVAKASTAAW